MSLVASYLAKQILKGNLDYDKVVKHYPQYKEEIDTYLEKNHFFD